jgi:hypothetical protein
MQDSFDIDVITALDGREVDVTREIGRLISISLHYHPEDEIDPSERQFIHRFGWGVIAVAGPKMPFSLIDDMLESKEINPAFAAYLRTRWADRVAKCA